VKSNEQFPLPVDRVPLQVSPVLLVTVTVPVGLPKAADTVKSTLMDLPTFGVVVDVPVITVVVEIGVTTSVTEAVTSAKSVLLVGVNLRESVCVPAFSTFPLAGV
jgi:hypothetical protein